MVENCPADVVLVIDKSGSMYGDFDKVRSFARNIVTGFPFVSDDQTRVGIIVFDSNTSPEVCEKTWFFKNSFRSDFVK